MRIIIEHFHANDPELALVDVIRNFRIGVTDDGIINCHFETHDKYVSVTADGTAHTPDYNGQWVRVMPHLYDDVFKPIGRNDVAFYSHPDFWVVEFVIETEEGKYYAENVTALKNEYFISLVPYEMVMNYDCLEKATVVELE